MRYEIIMTCNVSALQCSHTCNQSGIHTTIPFSGGRKKNARFFILSLRILVPSVFLSARIHFGNKLLLALLQMLPRLLNAIKLKLNGINKNGKLNT